MLQEILCDAEKDRSSGLLGNIPHLIFLHAMGGVGGSFVNNTLFHCLGLPYWWLSYAVTIRRDKKTKRRRRRRKINEIKMLKSRTKGGNTL